jgi:putative phosphoribosyl transferase
MEFNPFPQNSLASAVHIPAGEALLAGDLHVPASPRGMVLFAHGSGSSRHSPRNRFVAQALQQAGLATLLLDLLTETEEPLDRLTGELRFHIALLTRRLLYAVDWIGRQPALAPLSLGCFGASTGAAAALAAAAQSPAIATVVSRGGRPDLAGSSLSRVRVPVLLLVGAADREVLDLNRQAAARLRTESALEIIPGATHLFEEPGALEQVALLARDWFRGYLSHPRQRLAA